MTEDNDYQKVAQQFAALAATAHSPGAHDACRELADGYAALARFHARTAWLQRAAAAQMGAQRWSARQRGE